MKCVFRLSLQFLSQTFFILRRTERDMTQNVYCSLCKVPVTFIVLYAKCPLFLSDLMKLEFSRQIFEKCINIKFHKNPSSVSRVVPCGLTGGHEEALCCFSQFCERTKYVKWNYTRMLLH